jgi:pimeloyl-ACP methyl ester carboxylesterase
MGLGLYGGAQAPVTGEYVTVDGTRLHYIDRGEGLPVVLLHGNGSMIADFVSSGITERVGSGYRIVAFDRPGFGYSERPRGRKWGPVEQARLLLQAFDRLDIDEAIVVGHSWGTLVALATALEDARRVAGLVLLSGYYYPSPHPVAHATGGSAFSMVDNMMWQAVMPFVWRMRVPGAVRTIFAPCPVPDRFKETYSIPDALRPSQMRAVHEEAAMLGDVAQSLGKLYKDVRVPVRLIAGSDDRVVDTRRHSARLHLELDASTLQVVPRCGHMVHHAAPDDVVAAIHGVHEGRSRTHAVVRQWLHIDAHFAERATAVH